MKEISKEIKDIIDSLQSIKTGSSVKDSVDALKNLALSLEYFEKIRYDRLSDNLNKMSSIGESLQNSFVSFKEASKGFRSSKLTENFSKTIKDISSSLIAFSEISIRGIERNIKELEYFKTSFVSLSAILNDLNEKFTEIRTENISNVSYSLSEFSRGLESFASIDIESLNYNLASFKKNYSKTLGNILSTIKSDNIDVHAAEDIGNALKNISDGVASFSKIDLSETYFSLINIDDIAKSLKSIVSKLSKIDISERDSKEIGDALYNIGEGLKTFSEIETNKLHNVLKWFSGSSVKYFNELNNVFKKLENIELYSIARKFGKPIQDIAIGLKYLSEINVADLKYVLKKLPSIIKPLNEVSVAFNKGLDLIRVSKITKPLKNLGEGFKSISTINIKDLKTVVNKLPFIAEKLKEFSERINGFSLKGIETFGNELLKAGISLGKGAEKFGSIITNFFKGISWGAILKGTVLMGIVAGSLWVSAKSLAAFGDLDFTAALKGIGVLTLVTGGIIGLGALLSGPQAALVLLGAAGLLGVAGTFNLIGRILSNAAPYYEKFSGVFNMFSETLLKGLSIYSDTFKSVLSFISENLKTVFDGFIELAKIGPGLITAAGGIYQLALALTAFSGVQIGNSIFNFFGKILNSNPITALKELSLLGDGLNLTAAALERISKILNSNISSKNFIKSIDDLNKIIKDNINLQKIKLPKEITEIGKPPSVIEDELRIKKIALSPIEKELTNNIEENDMGKFEKGLNTSIGINSNVMSAINNIISNNSNAIVNNYNYWVPDKTALFVMSSGPRTAFS